MVDRLYEPSKEQCIQQNPLSDLQTKNKLIRSLYGLQGFAKQHIDSFDEFINFRINQIITSKLNRRIVSDSVPSFWMEYTEIRVALPTFEKNYDKYSRVSNIYPHEARTSNLSYSADIFVDFKYHVANNVVEERKNVKIGRMPIMVGSSRCHLRNLSHHQLSELQECPYDPRGYFIINGTQKVILIQQQMIENRILVERNNKLDTIVAGVISYTIDTKTMCEMLVKNGRMYVRSGSFSQLIPVFVLFKAFGMDSDQEVFQLVNCDHQLEEYLVLSLEDCYQRNVFTSEEAVHYLSTKLWKKTFESKKTRDPVQEVRDKLCNIFLAHIKVTMDNMFAKAQYLALMMKKLIQCIKDPSRLDNRDYYGNKRMKCAGTLLELLFEDRFKVFNSELREELNKFLIKRKDQRFEIMHLLESKCGIITHGLHNAIATGNWVIKRYHIDRKGVSQQLSRISYISAIGMITRLNSQFEKTRKIAGPRALLGSHWGLICPCDTPDGQGCGLVKNLALTTCITTSCRNFKFRNLGIIEGNLSQGKGHRVILDGTLIGYTFSEELVTRLRLMRRKGLVEKFVNVAIIKGKDQQFGQIIINTDSGRLVRPLLILDNGRILLTKHKVDQLQTGQLTFDDLVSEGYIQFLDVNEEDNALIGLTEKELTRNHTHLQIDPFTIIGVVAGIIPYPHHNQSPRNLFQCSMGKQAQGIIGLNELVRNDTVNYLLAYPQQPMVKTSHIELIHYNHLPAGQNASVAVMSYSGYDIEDAVIVNQSSLDRGFGRTFYFRKYEAELKKHGDFGLKDMLYGKTDQLKANDKKHLSGFLLKKYQCLDEDGLSKVGHNIQSGEVFVNKKVPVVSGDLKDVSFQKLQQNLTWNSQPSVFKSNSLNNHIDRVILTSNDQNTVVKTITRQMRRPELGDKFSSRHGQKGVCGLIVPEADMPFSETGWKPDLIMNPHGYPSRMTVGKLLELIGGKAGTLKGKKHYGTAFSGDKLQDLSNILLENGFSCNGKDTLISGTTGQYMDCYVFSGPIFYQRLKHMVADKIHARSTGKVTVLTRQPTEGRSKEGGLRLGQMQRDCLLGFGAGEVLLERLLYSSDDSTVLICENCGFFQYGVQCKSCRSSKVCKVKMPYACKLLMQELIGMGIRPKINLGKIGDNPFREELLHK